MLKATETNKKGQPTKTKLERAQEFPLRLQGAFALYNAMQIIENGKDEMTPEEYAEQIEMIAHIAENLAPFVPEA